MTLFIPVLAGVEYFLDKIHVIELDRATHSFRVFIKLAVECHGCTHQRCVLGLRNVGHAAVTSQAILILIIRKLNEIINLVRMLIICVTGDLFYNKDLFLPVQKFPLKMRQSHNSLIFYNGNPIPQKKVFILKYGLGPCYSPGQVQTHTREGGGIHMIGQQLHLLNLHEDVAGLGLCIVLHQVGHNLTDQLQELLPLTGFLLQVLPFWWDLPRQMSEERKRTYRLIGPLEVWIKFWKSYFPANSNGWWKRYLLWNCPQMNVNGPYWWWVNIGSGHGLVPSGNKPLPEPMLTQIYVAIWCH